MPNSSLFHRDKSDIIRGGTSASQIELLSYKTLAVCVRMF